MKIRTTEGDMLDQICLKYYGRADLFTKVLAANPGLPATGAVLPAGLHIELPDIEQPKEQKQTVRLWD